MGSSTNFGRDYGSTPTVNGAPVSTSNPEPIAGSVSQGAAGSEASAWYERLVADARNGSLSGGLWTLGSTSTPETINIPDWARGFRLRPSADTRFAINEVPGALNGETLVVGNTAYANETEVRLLADGTGRVLQLLGTSAGQTVGVGFF